MFAAQAVGAAPWASLDSRHYCTETGLYPAVERHARRLGFAVHLLLPGASAEREDVRAHARVVERDLEGGLGDRPAEAHELVHPRVGDAAGARRVGVRAVVVTGRPAV